MYSRLNRRAAGDSASLYPCESEVPDTIVAGAEGNYFAGCIAHEYDRSAGGRCKSIAKGWPQRQWNVRRDLHHQFTRIAARPDFDSSAGVPAVVFAAQLDLFDRSRWHRIKALIENLVIGIDRANANRRPVLEMVSAARGVELTGRARDQFVRRA